MDQTIVTVRYVDLSECCKYRLNDSCHYANCVKSCEMPEHCPLVRTVNETIDNLPF